MPGAPCEVTVAAEAADPDGDALTFAWSGCASGSQTRSSCRVERPGSMEAAVVVSDSKGNSTRASAVVEGINRPPEVMIGYVTAFAGSFELLGNVKDPEEGFPCGRQYCATAVTSGACGPAFLECTCLAGLVASVVKTASAGVCTVTFSLRDSWGLEGQSSFSFDVSRPSGRVASRHR